MTKYLETDKYFLILRQTTNLPMCHLRVGNVKVKKPMKRSYQTKYLLIWNKKQKDKKTLKKQKAFHIVQVNWFQRNHHKKNKNYTRNKSSLLHKIKSFELIIFRFIL